MRSKFTMMSEDQNFRRKKRGLERKISGTLRTKEIFLVLKQRQNKYVQSFNNSTNGPWGRKQGF